MSSSTILYILITTLNPGNTQIWSKFKRKKNSQNILTQLVYIYSKFVLLEIRFQEYSKQNLLIFFLSLGF